MPDSQPYHLSYIITAITIGPSDGSAAPHGKVPSQSDATQRSGVSQHTTEEEEEEKEEIVASWYIQVNQPTNPNIGILTDDFLSYYHTSKF